MEIEDLVKNVKQDESLKLIKMSKGFNWEIKLVGNVDDSQLERLKKLNEKLEVEYGSHRTDMG